MVSADSVVIHRTTQRWICILLAEGEVGFASRFCKRWELTFNMQTN